MNTKPQSRRRVFLRWIVPALSVLVLILLITGHCSEPVHRWVEIGSEYDGHLFVADSRITLGVLSHDSKPAGLFQSLRYPLLPSFAIKLWSDRSNAQLRKQREDLLHRAGKLRGKRSKTEEMQVDALLRESDALMLAQAQTLQSLQRTMMQREVRDLVRKRGCYGLLLAIDTKPRNSAVLSIPIWLPVCVAAPGILIPIFRWVRPQRFRNPIACRQCQYMLRGLTRAICPECGSAIPEKQWRLVAEELEGRDGGLATPRESGRTRDEVT